MWKICGKLIAAKGFQNCPKSNKLPNSVTLTNAIIFFFIIVVTHSCNRLDQSTNKSR